MVRLMAVVYTEKVNPRDTQSEFRVVPHQSGSGWGCVAAAGETEEGKVVSRT